MALYPYPRIAYLTGLELAPHMQPREWEKTGRTATPVTISGSPHAIQSYQLTIGHTDNRGRGWWVYEGKNSVTTNRHVRALRAVLEHNGYQPTDELRDDDAGIGRHITRRLWVKA